MKLLLRFFCILTGVFAGGEYFLNPSIEHFGGYFGANISEAGLNVVNSIANQLMQFKYQPVALLVQDKEEVLKSADVYINSLLASYNFQCDLWLMKFNASGVTSLLARSSLMSGAAFRNLIYDKKQLHTSKYLGANTESAVDFFAILKASRLLPPRSAILLFTDSRVEDEDLAQLAIKEAQMKQIRIYVVWQGMHPTQHREEGLLRESTGETRGNFFIGNTERMLSNSVLVSDNSKTNDIIAHHTNMQGNKIVYVPIDDEVSGIHITISGPVQRAHLTTPSGYLIDLLNSTSLAWFSEGSYAVQTSETLEIDLNTAHGKHASPVVGTWRLETDAARRFAQASAYNITISAQTALMLDTKLIRLNSTRGNLFRLGVLGDVAKIDQVVLLGDNEENRKLTYKIKQNLRGADDIETFQGTNIDINVDDLPSKSTYVLVRGKDTKGNVFQRVSYYNPNNLYNIIQPTTIELVEGSELLVSPNSVSNLLFQVNNNRNQAIFVNFHCRDEKRLLRWMQPRWAWINPHQKVIVTVSTLAPPSPAGDRNLVTFGAISGTERTEKSVIVMVNANNKLFDNESPHMWHTFSSDCLNALFGRCYDYTWTIQVTAQDKETGLLSVATSPEGLYFPHGYISGTTEEVTGTYSGSCCQSSIVLTAIDLVHNRRSYVADAYWARLGAAAISAVVLAVIILIILIVAIVVCCKKGKCKCGKTESDSWNLWESYRGPSHTASNRRH